MGTRLIIGILACMMCSSLVAERQAEKPADMDDVVHMVSPRYPHQAARSRIGGTGVFRISIDFKTGKVRNVTVVKSTGSDGLDREAVLALRRWRFKPGKARQVEMPITFHNGSEPLVLPPGAILRPSR